MKPFQQEDTIQVNGRSVSFVRMGQKGPLVVILPGWDSLKEKWLPVQKMLATEGYCSICVDLPGFGNSQDPPPTWRSKDYAYWLESFFGLMTGSEQVILMGHSFGGKVASLYTAAHPKQVIRLILLASAGIPASKTFRQLTTFMASKLFGQLFKLPLLRAGARPLKKLLYRFSGSNDYYKANDNMKKVLKSVVREDMRSVFESIAVKTTIVWGSADRVTPLWQGKQIHELIKNSSLQIILGASHNFAYDHNEFLNQLKNIIEAG